MTHCVDCDRKITPQGRRCYSCASKHKWESSSEKMKLLRKNARRYCIDCGKKLSKNVNAKRCKSCASQGKYHPCWKGGISFLPYCEKFNDDLKERVREFFDRKCYICGKSEIENNKRLSVHHVNYDKMICCNDMKPLFVPLCHSCHMKTNFNREFWQEFFTASLEFLTDGECYIKKEK